MYTHVPPYLPLHPLPDDLHKLYLHMLAYYSVIHISPSRPEKHHLTHIPSSISHFSPRAFSPPPRYYRLRSAALEAPKHPPSLL